MVLRLKSIEKKIEKGNWFTGSKLKLLVQHYKEDFSDKSNLSKRCMNGNFQFLKVINFSKIE